MLFRSRSENSSSRFRESGEIRRLLGLKSGDKILFYQKPSGEVVINNASAQAIYKAQKAFEGVAEQMGVYNEDDVQALVNEVRYGKGKE